MKSYTRAEIVFQHPKDLVFDAVLKTLEDINVQVTMSEKSSYKIEAKSPINIMRTGFNIWVFLTDIPDSGTLLEIFDSFPVLSPNSPDKRFMDKFFKTLGKQLPLNDNYGIQVISIESNTTIAASGVLQNPSLLCNICKKNNFHYSFQGGQEKICRMCFEYKFGKTILFRESAEYYGGHKAYLAGGLFSKSQAGKLLLTDQVLLFETNDKDLSKKWEIILPLKDVIIDQWHIEEVARRKQISGIGGTLGEGNIGLGTGAIHETGKAHHIVIAYVDQNGIPQQPKFGVTSFRGKAIREWSGILYDQIVKAKTKLPVKINEMIEQSNDESLKILKVRLAKGEISLQEYEDLRKVLES